MGFLGMKGHNEKEIAALNKTASKVDVLSDKYFAMTDDELKAQTALLKERLNKGETLDNILPDAFALVRETSARVLNMRHFFVQIVGAIALHQGRIAQMATGEGKTLVATMPAYLNALSGKSVHIVTVNDYLAKRDAEWMGKIYKFLGLTVGVIVHNQNNVDKKKAYESDITYGTNNEFGFDYLRDNMAISKGGLVMRGLDFAIIDEVDSILIDEARTPLIISGKGNRSSDKYISANKFVRTLNSDDYDYEEKENTIRLSDNGIEKAEKFFRVENLGDINNSDLSHYILQGLKAVYTMKRDVDYIVEKGEVVIVDEFTGRKMEGRRYNGGLHQAIEAKENVRIKEESKTLATITFQNLFRLYKKLSGMTGTAKTEEAEFNSIYVLDVVEVPTNMAMIREDYNDVIYKTTDGKYRAIIADIEERHKSGQPILVGTISIENSEKVSALLHKIRIPHNVLNAKEHEREAEIVAQAGRMGAVTIATNMAGRGTDILLGGNPEFLAKRELLGQKIDNALLESATSYKADKSEEEIRVEKLFRESYEKYKKETDEEKKKVVAAGGLHILGTERHESRRIDNQLRGRSGRQGDPGTSVFFISLEDDLARVFGGDKLKSVLNFLRVSEDMPIEGKFFTKQIENAQKRIEDNNFATRKHVLQYDDVMNGQRNRIYAERNKVLHGEDIHSDVLSMADTVCEDLFNTYIDPSAESENWNIADLNKTICHDFFIDKSSYIKKKDVDNLTAAEILEKLKADMKKTIESRIAETEKIGVDFKELERFVMLKIVDDKWMDHIDAMDNMRKGVGLMAFGQKNPVDVYRSQGFDMFNAMISEIQYDTVKYCLRVTVRRVETAPSEETKKKIRASNPEISRNAMCPCGSGKKYKHCCGKE